MTKKSESIARVAVIALSTLSFGACSRYTPMVENEPSAIKMNSDGSKIKMYRVAPDGTSYNYVLMGPSIHDISQLDICKFSLESLTQDPQGLSNSVTYDSSNGIADRSKLNEYQHEAMRFLWLHRSSLGNIKKPVCDFGQNYQLPENSAPALQSTPAPYQNTAPQKENKPRVNNQEPIVTWKDKY